MTIPWLMNCPHTDDGWCLDCVADLGDKYQNLKQATHPSVGPYRFAQAIAEGIHGFKLQIVLDELERVKADRDRLRDLAPGAPTPFRDAALRFDGRAELLREIAADLLNAPSLPLWQVLDRLECLLEKGDRASKLVFRLRAKVSKLSAREGNVRRVVELLERAADKLNLKVFFGGSPDIPGLHDLRTALALLKTGIEEGR